MVRKNTCVFISGAGSNLKNLIRKTRDYNFPINIRLIICNNKGVCIENILKNKFYLIKVD